MVGGDRPPWAKALKVLRLIRRWNRAQLGRAAGLSASAITRYEKGNRRPEEVRSLVSVMGYPPLLWERTLAFVASTEGEHPNQTAPGETAPSPRIDALVGDAGRWVNEVVREALTGAFDALGGTGARPRLRTPPIGEALAILRAIRGWERKDLADAVARPEETVANYEYGKTKPKLLVLQELLSAMGFSLAVFECALDFVRTAQESRRTLAGGGRVLSWQVEEVAAQKARRIEEFTRTELSALTVAAQVLASREAAPVAWKAFSACPEVSRLELVRQVAEFQTAGFCELLCEESLAAASDSASRARQLAQLAEATAELAEGGQAFRSRLRGYAGAHLANAERVAGRDLPAAEETLERALAAWDAGDGADSGLLNAARVCGLTASLRRAQRRLPEALAALDEGLKIDRWGETPTLLLAKARALVELGEYGASIEQLRAAAPWVHGEREPRKLFVIENLLVSNLCRLGQFAAAERRLPGLRQLALPNRLDLLRAAWQTGIVAAGLGRADEALAILEQVRTDFIATENFYVAALVTLELAEVHAGLGHTAEVKELARKSAPVFENQQVHCEAQRALALFRQAAEEEKVTGGLLRQLIVYLHRARHNPQLCFATAA